MKTCGVRRQQRHTFDTIPVSEEINYPEKKKNNLLEHQIRGWRAVSADGLHGQCSPERICFSQTPVVCNSDNSDNDDNNHNNDNNDNVWSRRVSSRVPSEPLLVSTLTKSTSASV